MSEQKSIADSILLLLEKYQSGEFAKIDCSVVLHKRDAEIEKLKEALKVFKSALQAYAIGIENGAGAARCAIFKVDEILEGK